MYVYILNKNLTKAKTKRSKQKDCMKPWLIAIILANCWCCVKVLKILAVLKVNLKN